jgi:O-acetyl-ADP-ribose deacetylase (regulator of RNase III)
MKPENVKGDLLESDCKIIAHCCNCFHTMGGGIALSIRNKYPEAYRADNKTSYGQREKLGTISHAETSDGKIVVNMYAQYSFGTEQQHLNYGKLGECFNQIKNLIHSKFVDDIHNVTLGFPYFLGCGLAGGDWDTVKRIIHASFLPTSYRVLIYNINEK